MSKGDTLDKQINRKKTPTQVKPAESALSEILKKDKQLSEDKPRLQLFLSLAQAYDEDLKDNLKLSAFQLDDKYHTYNPHGWLEFKQYPPVRKYITQFLDEQQLAQARQAVSEGFSKTKEAIDLQSIIEGKQKSDQNTNVIVFFMPQKNYFKE